MTALLQKTKNISVNSLNKNRFFHYIIREKKLQFLFYKKVGLNK